MPRDPALRPYGYQQLTVSTVAVSLTCPAGAVYAKIRCESNPIRIRADAVNPTSSVGTPMLADEQEFFTSKIASLRFIRSGGADAILNIEYFG